MTRFCEFLVAGLSRLLDSTTRDVVIGDLAELNLGLLRSIWELCGMIARQQASLWKEWRPWLALLGIAGLAGIRLTFVAGVLLSWPLLYIRTYLKYGVMYQSGVSVTGELVVWFSMAAAVVLWSWTAGFAFAALARRTAFAGGFLLCIVWLGWNVIAIRLILSVSPWSLILLVIPWVLFFVPATCGVRQGFRQGDLSFQRAIVLLVLTVGVLALVTWTSGWAQAGVERWSEGALPGGTPWYRRLFTYLLSSWPALWIAARSGSHLECLKARHRVVLK